jgi:hypothetical protein
MSLSKSNTTGSNSFCRTKTIYLVPCRLADLEGRNGKKKVFALAAFLQNFFILFLAHETLLGH